MPDENNAPAAPQVQTAVQPTDTRAREKEEFHRRLEVARTLGIPKLCARKNWVDNVAFMSLRTLWEQYHEKFETPEMKKLSAEAKPRISMHDLLRIPSNKLDGFEGRFKEEKLQDAMSKTSELFMLHVLVAIRLNELRDLEKNYRLG